MKTFVEIHAIQNFAPSNLNRDDTGAPKDAFFGGSRRARISSQCIKRSIREYFRDRLKGGLFTDEMLAVRTKRILDALVELLAKQGHELEESKAKVKAALASVGIKIKADEKSEYLLFVGWQEMRRIAEKIHDNWDLISLADAAVGEEKAKKGSGKKEKGNNEEIGKVLRSILDGGKAVDIALFGRMLADMPDKNQDAACQVAHAISTHRVEREFDYYTAVDDRKPDDTAGADMIGTVEFNSACFYRYAVVDWEKLVQNLQGDDDLAKKTIRAFIEGFIVAEPTGKQNTFAAHNPPEFVAVSVRRDALPCSFASAFEIAVRSDREESLSKKSATCLVEKAKALRLAFGGGGETYVLNLVDANIAGFGERADRLDDLLDKAQSAL